MHFSGADFPLGSLQSRAVARALAHAKKKDKNTIQIVSFAWEPDHPPEFRNSFVDSDGKLSEVWTVPRLLGETVLRPPDHGLTHQRET